MVNRVIHLSRGIGCRVQGRCVAQHMGTVDALAQGVDTHGLGKGVALMGVHLAGVRGQSGVKETFGDLGWVRDHGGRYDVRLVSRWPHCA